MHNISLFDTHSHVNDVQFEADREAVIAGMKALGVGALVVGTDQKMSEEAVRLSELHENLWATVGLHPTDNRSETFDLDFYEELVGHPRVVGIGECGLDYFHEKTEAGRALQKELFRKHLELAQRTKKPLMIHCRDAYSDLLVMLDAYPEVQGNVHFFAGTWSDAQEFLKRGFTLSFTGVITFANQYDEIIKKIPEDMFMVETDAPYVAPKPFRGKRNEPKYVTEVVKRIAELRQEPYEVIARQTLATAKRVWSLRGGSL